MLSGGRGSSLIAIVVLMVSVAMMMVTGISRTSVAAGGKSRRADGQDCYQNCQSSFLHAFSPCSAEETLTFPSPFDPLCSL
jgi:hypothetical protein